MPVRYCLTMEWKNRSLVLFFLCLCSELSHIIWRWKAMTIQTIEMLQIARYLIEWHDQILLVLGFRPLVIVTSSWVIALDKTHKYTRKQISFLASVWILTQVSMSVFPWVFWAFTCHQWSAWISHGQNYWSIVLRWHICWSRKFLWAKTMDNT